MYIEKAYRHERDRILIARSKKYLESAEILLRSGDYESSVSRVYYAMFYSVEALLLMEGISVSSHKGVISLFGERFIKTGIFGREMSKTLSRAFEKRQLGDYEYTFVISEDEAKEMSDEGRNFVERIGWLFGDKRGIGKISEIYQDNCVSLNIHPPFPPKCAPGCPYIITRPAPAVPGMT